MKKIVDIVKGNWMFVFFLLPFILICFENKIVDNDIWFLLNNGKYVLSNGIPTIEPFTIHEGLNYVMQQWGTSVLFWGLFSLFGKQSLLIFIYIFSFLLMFVFYKLCFVVSEKKNLSIILTTLTFSFINKFIVLRPQIISFLLILFEVLCLELYIKRGNKNYLIALPFISLIMVNFHSSMWYYLFVFLLPFICNAIPLEKFKSLKGYRIDKYQLKPIMISMIFMFLVGFINPYGIDAMNYVFNSYGIETINEMIIEMNPLSFVNYNGKIVLGSILLLFVLFFLRKDLKFDIRHLCFICGGTILAFMHNKCFPWFVFFVLYSLAYYFRDFKFKQKNKLLDNKYFYSISNGIIYGLVIMGITSLCYLLYYSYSNYEFSSGELNNIYENATKYVVEHYDVNNVRLFVDFYNGGYTEYMGLKSFIDPRAEVFVKKFNNKSDILDEYKQVMENSIYDFESFLKKYNFTHLFVSVDSYLEIYLRNSKDYELVYEERNFLDENGRGYLFVYVVKNKEVLV